jgi:hypothetical protein
MIIQSRTNESDTNNTSKVHDKPTGQFHKHPRTNKSGAAPRITELKPHIDAIHGGDVVVVFPSASSDNGDNVDCMSRCRTCRCLLL